jgi:enamine deaminase RidA (YjgF/YER057c/UK114 family)
MAQRETINPPGLHPPPGFSHIAFSAGTRLIFIAGQVAVAPDLSIIGLGDLAEQTRAAMRNVQIALQAVGATFDDVVRRTIYTTQPTEFEAIAAAVEEVQGSSNHPAQTVIGVTGLALVDLMIEIEVTVVLP